VRLIIPFALSLFLIQGLFWTGGTPIVALGPLSLKAEGLTFALAMSGRILIIFSSFLWLAMTTRPDALMLALVQKGLPDRIAYIVLTTLQIVPRFQAKAATILNAQRSRGLETEGSLIRRIRGVLPLVVPLVLGSIVDIEERAIALEARAFSRQGERTSLVDLPDSAAQRVFRWMLVVIVATLAVARIARVIV
jgi:energy-coupling factor transport system permease protein